MGQEGPPGQKDGLQEGRQNNRSLTAPVTAPKRGGTVSAAPTRH